MVGVDRALTGISQVCIRTAFSQILEEGVGCCGVCVSCWLSLHVHTVVIPMSYTSS